MPSELRSLLGKSLDLISVQQASGQVIEHTAALERKVSELEGRKRALEAESAHRQKTKRILHLLPKQLTRAEDEHGSKTDVVTKEEETSNFLKRVAQESSDSGIQAKLQAYRLAGVTFVPHSEVEVELRIETAHGRRYCETIYLFLRIPSDEMRNSNSDSTPGDKGKILVTRHTVPPFINLRQIAHDHLSLSLRNFTFELSDHMNAFVQRREGIEDLKQVLGPNTLPEDSIFANRGCTMVAFMLRNVEIGGGEDQYPKAQQLRIILGYDRVKDILPTRVLVSRADVTEHEQTFGTLVSFSLAARGGQRIWAWEDRLRRESLSTAIPALMGRRRDRCEK
eukprot:Clim_evm45s201 gene=Clim_evmTU45s201